MGTFYGNRTTRKGRRSPGADRALARRSMHGTFASSLFAFAQRLVAAGAAQPSELVRRWADVFGGRVARVGRTPAATGDCRADCGRRGRADGDRGVDDARVVLRSSPTAAGRGAAGPAARRVAVAAQKEATRPSGLRGPPRISTPLQRRLPDHV